MTIDEFIVKALKVPFIEKGRDFSGWDCWGCVRCAFKEIYGKELPVYLDYDSTTEYEQLKKLIVSGQKKWKKVDKPQTGDVAVFNISGMPTHTAFVVDGKMALHADKRIGTFIESLKSPIWAKRIEGFYRYE